MTEITRFIAKLSARANSDTVSNPYQDVNKAKNLEAYLRTAVEQKIKCLFVGEAPGYRGCNQTGIPFTSYEQLKEGVHPFIDSFVNNITVTNPGTTETTAKIFWQGLVENNKFNAVAWNTFPFHPHVNNGTKNRAPTSEEVQEGLVYLLLMIDIIKPSTIISVGGYADSLLRERDIEHFHVRHPSNDCKKAFPAQLKAVIDTVKALEAKS